MWWCIQTAEVSDFRSGFWQVPEMVLPLSLLKLLNVEVSTDSSLASSNSLCCSVPFSFETSLWLSKLHDSFLQWERSQGAFLQGVCARRWIPRWVRQGELSCAVPLLVTSSLTFLTGTHSVNDFEFLTFLLIKTVLTIDSGRTDSCSPVRETHTCTLVWWLKLRVYFSWRTLTDEWCLYSFHLWPRVVQTPLMPDYRGVFLTQFCILKT